MVINSLSLQVVGLGSGRRYRCAMGCHRSSIVTYIQVTKSSKSAIIDLPPLWLLVF
jgi:hypothetical protein